MFDCVELWLPWPPSINRYYSPGRNGGLYISARGGAFRSAVSLAVHEQLGAHQTITDRMACDVVLCPPNKRGFDLDNYMKSLLDALQHTAPPVIADDALIDRLSVLRGEIRPDGCARVLLSPITKKPAG